MKQSVIMMNIKKLYKITHAADVIKLNGQTLRIGKYTGKEETH